VVAAPGDRREFLGAGDLALGGLASAAEAAPALLPEGVKVVWDLEKAHRESTATRERVWLNGLWRWRPGRGTADPAGRKHLESAGLSLTPYAKDELASDRVLIVGPGGGKELAGDAAALGEWLRAGGHVLALGLDGGRPTCSCRPRSRRRRVNTSPRTSSRPG
jgi:hypothetical protein